MQYKRILTLGIVLVLSLASLGGCVSPTSTSSPPASSTTTPATTPIQTPSSREKPEPTPTQVRRYSLSTSVSPSGGGAISPASGTYDAGTEVTLTATPTSGYRFDHWSGDATGISSFTTLSMDKDKSVTAHFMPLYAAGQLKIGDYVQFGRYGGEPMLWRVIEDSANPNANVGDAVVGDPLLFSDRVICNKPFDAAGPHDDNNERLKKGSNLWQTSNIRAWLNTSAEAGAVKWPCGNPPKKESVTSNDYADEKGFLADGNFTEYERNLIKPATQKALLYFVDREMAESGSTAYKYNDEIEDIVNNYDRAWYHNVTDKVFLLDPKQVNGVYNRFGRYYYNHREDYWLRAPDTEIYIDSSSANVLYIRGRDGVVMYRQASDGSIGVRPGLTLNLKSVIFESGDGSDVNPYVVARQF